ncbi:hypothetical protein EG68_08005 [Paragonimus skrjabini miyazakii]|uniref:Uncharacterized protein n=1 Tax=Paragonimus skrjabini miyazakii TaxID=59628 RepID=A0A8S9Y8X6_9TREM|nr:hypothetical protein EG68_08005 [Paragonimus skrjabini miyazakii]
MRRHVNQTIRTGPSSTGPQAKHLTSRCRFRLVSDTPLPTDYQEPLLTTEHIRHMHSSFVRGHLLATTHLQAAQRHQKTYFDRRVYGTQLYPRDSICNEAVPPPRVLPKCHGD